MLIMPLQLAWAGVSVYCQHESGATTPHLGHHQHGHQGDESPGEPGRTLHPDCGLCQVATAALPDVCCLATYDSSRIFADVPHALGKSAPTSEPERPKWRCAA